MQQLEKAVAVPGLHRGKKALLVFFETDCPTCQLALPYLRVICVFVRVVGVPGRRRAVVRIREKSLEPLERDQLRWLGESLGDFEREIRPFAEKW